MERSAIKPKLWRGADVKALRLKYNLSQNQFEMITGIGQSRISDWENGIRKPGNLACWALDMIEIKLAEHFETQA